MLNEEMVKLFATILRLATNPEILKQLEIGIDFENLVRAIASTVPCSPIDAAAPIRNPSPWPLGNPFWSPNVTTVPNLNAPVIPYYATGETPKPYLSSMSQADGQGDDSGRRGD